ncbi:MAG: hypothetical protein ABMB14_00655 [Myxococcota bacterium]
MLLLLAACASPDPAPPDQAPPDQAPDQAGTEDPPAATGPLACSAEITIGPDGRAPDYFGHMDTLPDHPDLITYQSRGPEVGRWDTEVWTSYDDAGRVIDSRRDDGDLSETSTTRWPDAHTSIVETDVGDDGILEEREEFYVDDDGVAWPVDDQFLPHGPHSTWAYAYDAEGRLLRVEFDDGTAVTVTTYTWDGANSDACTPDSSDVVRCVHVERDDAGHVTLTAVDVYGDDAFDVLVFTDWEGDHLVQQESWVDGARFATFDLTWDPVLGVIVDQLYVDYGTDTATRSRFSWTCE